MNKIQQLKNILSNLDNSPIYIAGHIKPDQDSICSSLALALLLISIGKKAYVLLEDKDKDIIEWKGDYSLIINTINQTDYNFIALDLNEKKRLGNYQKYFDDAKFTINIDHHQDNKNEANFVYSDTKMSSTCEMIYNIIYSFGKEYLHKEICEYLYSGMMNDTNCFSRRLSSKTLSIAQNLINKDINYTEIIKKTYSSRTMYEFKALAKLVNEIKYDDFHYVIVDKKEPEFINLTHNQIVKKIAEDLRKIQGIDIFILLIKQDNTIVGKCMSNISENANKIAELFGGGGHKKEAGFTIESTSINEIILKIKNYLK